MVVEEDSTAAQVPACPNVWISSRLKHPHGQIEWRSPQLILNRPVGKQSVALDQVRAVRAPTEADSPALPKGGAGCNKDASIVIVRFRIFFVTLARFSRRNAPRRRARSAARGRRTLDCARGLRDPQATDSIKVVFEFLAADERQKWIVALQVPCLRSPARSHVCNPLLLPPSPPPSLPVRPA